MGNRRKILTAIFGVVLLAAGAVSGAFWALRPSTLADGTPVTNAATIPTSASGYTFSGTNINCATSMAITLTSGHVYYVEIAGQRGGNSSKTDYTNSSGYRGMGGYGAICYGFVKATTSTANYYTAKVGWNGGMDGKGNNSDYDSAGVGNTNSSSTNRSGAGGGYSSFSEINFALPSTYTGGTTQGIAGGGGGASQISSTGLSYGGNGGYDKGYPAYIQRTASGTRYYFDRYCTQSVVGKGANGTSGAKGEDTYFGGGGGGYTGGSTGSDWNKWLGLWAGTAPTNNGTGNSWPSGTFSGYQNYGGSGGTSSPNLYCAQTPSKYGDDGHNGFGYVKIVDIYPTKVPAANNPTDGSAATITDGTANNPRNCQWQWSTNGGSTWTTTKPTRTAVGSQTVNWRYVVTGTSPYGQTIPTTVIASGSLTLTVTNKAGTVAAPTLTSNPVYTGNAIKVVTALGQSSGTFTFATAKKEDEEALNAAPETNPQ